MSKLLDHAITVLFGAAAAAILLLCVCNTGRAPAVPTRRERETTTAPGLSSPVPAPAPVAARTAGPEARPASAALFAAIRQVESGGDANAIGDRGRSKGPYGITKPFWEDGRTQGKVEWQYDRWVRNREKCEQIIKWYWERYGAETEMERVLLFNQGCGYWLKYQAALEEH